MCVVNMSALLKSLALIFFVGLLSHPSWASDPFGNSTLTPSHNSPRGIAFDQVNWNRIQGVFSWITMARGFSDTPLGVFRGTARVEDHGRCLR